MTDNTGPQFDPEDWSPVTLGPAWQRNEDGTFALPERTLGWECLRWTYEYLKGPDGGPWKFTAEQARMILWWYALDEDGNFLYDDGIIQRVKGWGKDPWAAALIAFELCGNCRFSHWDKNGKPVAKQPHEPWIQVAAVSKEQTKNTMKLFPGLFSKAAIKKYGIKIGRVLIHALDGRARVEAVTSSPQTLEGGRPSLLVLNETHHWTASNDGELMALTGRANAAKVGGRALAITNAPQPGMNSVAETDRRAYEDYLAGKTARDNRTMYDSLEAPPQAPLIAEVIPLILTIVRGDSVWLNVDRTTREILDPRTPLARSRRFYYNQIVAADDALIAASEWDPCRNPRLDPLYEGDEIVMGLDGGKSDDATALIAIRIRDRAIFPLGIWEKPPGEAGDTWEVDMTAVDDLVGSSFRKYKVRAFFSDVNPIQSYVDRWSDEFRNQLLVKAVPGKSAVGFDMRGNQQEITRANEALVGAIRERAITFGTDSDALQDRKLKLNLILREHVLNCFQRENRWGMSFGKESRESDRKVDAYAATLLAYVALNKYLESGKTPKKERSGKGWFF